MFRPSFVIRAITSVMDGETEITGKNWILNAHHYFYLDLYRFESVDRIVINNLLYDWSVHIPEDMRTWLAASISEEDLIPAEKTMPSWKAPGPDGLPSRFYKAFWPNLEPILFMFCNDLLSVGNNLEFFWEGTNCYTTQEGWLVSPG